MDDLTTDPLKASAYMRQITEAVRAFDRALHVGPHALDPFRGQTTIGKTWREQVLASRDFEPIRKALVGYIDLLFERRLNLGVSLSESAQLTQVECSPESPFNEASTFGARRVMALSASADPERREEARLAWGVLSRGATQLSSLRVLRYERLIEAEERLGAELSSPVSFAEGETTEQLALAALSSTKEAAQQLLPPGFSGLMEGATAMPATEGWPARLAVDTLLALLGGQWLVKDVRGALLDLPDRVCPASFARAAVHFGRELYRAAAPEALPFVVARSAGEVHGRALGRQLALWLFSDACARRRLGLSVARTQHHARGRARLLLSETRILAARALLAEAGRQSRTRLEQTWGELGVELAGGSWGAPLGLLSAPPDASVDFVSHLWAAHKHAQLVRTYDEDYLDNPRAREAIVAELHSPEPPHPDHATLSAAVADLARAASDSAVF